MQDPEGNRTTNHVYTKIGRAAKSAWEVAHNIITYGKSAKRSAKAFEGASNGNMCFARPKKEWSDGHCVFRVHAPPAESSAVCCQSHSGCDGETERGTERERERARERERERES
jgi:hypothetical protein